MDKNRRFVKQTDVARCGLKGKVKSIITYKYSFVDSSEHCNYIQRVKFNTEGFLVEEIDTIAGRSFYVYNSSYNKDGLLAKLVYAPSEPFYPSVDTYMYSFGEGKKTCITRNPDSSWSSADTTVSLYDSNGNEIESRSGNTKTISKYDEHGFLVWEKHIRPSNILETNYVNDDKGRVLKKSCSDGTEQAFIYDKEGNQIQETLISPYMQSGKSFTGYCEFDEKGNYLKSITVCPRIKYAYMTRRVIEYY